MKIFLLTAFFLVLSSEAFAQLNDREIRGLKGPVKTVSLESTTVSVQTGEAISTIPLIKQQISFDKEGRTIEDLVLDAGGNQLQKSLFDYEIDGSQVLTRFMFDGTIEKLTYRYKYDSFGRVIETLIFSEGKLTGRSERAYDPEGRFIEGKTYDGDGTLSNRSVTTYDENGKIKRFVLYDGKGGVIHQQVPYEITYVNQPGVPYQNEKRKQPLEDGIDSYGNWTKQTTPTTVTQAGKSEEVLKIVKRTITYY